MLFCGFTQRNFKRFFYPHAQPLFYLLNVLFRVVPVAVVVVVVAVAVAVAVVVFARKGSLKK